MKQVYFFSKRILSFFLFLCLFAVTSRAQSEKESNNNFASANPLLVNTEVAGSLCPSGDEDYFVATLPSDGMMRIYIQKTNTEAGYGSFHLTAYDGRKGEGQIFSKEIGSYWDNGVGIVTTDSVDVYCRSAGETIYFRTSQSNHCFDYKLSYKVINRVPGNDREGNNSFEQATLITPGEALKGHVGYTNAGTVDAVDYYKTVVPSVGTVRVYLEGTKTGSGYGGLYLTGYDRRKEAGQLFSREPVNYWDISGNTFLDSVDLFCRAAGDTLHFKVSQSNQCFAYTLRYRMINVPTTVDAEPNNTFSEAVSFRHTDTISGNIGYVAGGVVNDDADFFKTVLPKDGRFRLYVERRNTGSGYGDFWIQGFNNQKENGLLFSQGIGSYWDNSGKILVDSIDVTCRAAGDTIYLKASQSNNCFSYRMYYRVLTDDPDVDQEANNTFTEAVSIQENSVQKGHIGYFNGNVSDDADFYKTVLPSGGTIRVYIKRRNTNGSAYGDFGITFYDSRGEDGVITSKTVGSYWDNSGKILVDSIDLTCRAAGETIYFRASRANSCFAYEFSYKMLAVPVSLDTEPNSSFTGAGVLKEAEQVIGTIGSFRAGVRDDEDYFKTVLPASGIVRLYLERRKTGGPSYGDFGVAAYDGRKGDGYITHRNIGGYWDNSVEPVMDSIDLFCRAAGDTIYFRINGTNTCYAYKFSYKVLMGPNQTAPDPESNNSFGTATLFGAKETVKAFVGYSIAGVSDEVDYFKTKVPLKGTVRLYVQATQTAGGGHGTFSLTAFDKDQAQFFTKNIATNVGAGTTVYDTLDFFCRTPEDLYLKLERQNTCFSYQLRYEVLLGADTTVHTCGGCTIDISKLYNTAPFSVVKYEDTKTPGTAVDPKAVGGGTYMLSVYNGKDECSRDTAMITVVTGQIIVFDSIPDKVYGAPPFVVKATSSAGLPVTYSVFSGPATINKDTVTITGTGEITVRAEQAGNSTFNYAVADRTFKVSKAAATVTLSEKEKVYDGKPGAPKATTNPASLPVAFTYNGSGTAPVAAGRYDVVATINHELYTGSVADTFLIKKAEQTVSLSPVSDRNFSTAPFSITATATSGLPVSFSLSTTPAGIASIDGNVITLSGLGTIIITAVQNGNENYHPSPAVKDTFTVTKGEQVITFAGLPDQRIGDTVVLKATASSNLPVTYSLTTTPATGVAQSKGDTVLLNGTAGSVTVTATQAGNDSYAKAEAQRTFRVLGRQQNITFDSIPNKIFGDAPFTINATASSGLPVSFRIVSGPATIDKNVITLTGDGTVVVEASQGGSSTFDAAPAVQRSFVVRRKYVDLFVQNVNSTATLLGPNDAATITWTVGNSGEIASATNWTERLYMQAANGENRTLLRQVTHTSNDSLFVGRSVTRTESISIPAQLNIGNDGVFVVEVVPGTNIKEAPVAQPNNIAVQSTAWTVKKILSLELSVPQLTEGSSDAITAKVTRTGSLAGALTVSLGAKAPARFSFPSTVTIPAGQASQNVSFTATNNSLIEGTIHDSLTVSASGFAGAKAAVSILDDDKPTLLITGLPADMTEGQSVTFTISTDLLLTQPLQVLLTSNNRARFPVPASATIPAGAKSVNVTVTLEQNQTPEIDVPVSIIAGAANHHSANGTITVKDDDIPGLQLVVATNTISEAGGAYATKATLRRTATSNPAAFTANLSASLQNTLILPSTISLASGESEKTFDIGVIDNTLMDGDRQVSITASMFVASCGCNAPATSSGTVSASITVTDNDGPALTVSASSLTLAEGLSDAGKLRITRNTATTAALSVNLSSSNTAEATVPATATIAAGQSFVEVPITTVNDGKTDGNQQVYLQATAQGFSSGTVWVIVSDQNKPDLLVPAVRLESSTVQAMAIFNYTLSIRNTGFATAPPGVVVRGYLSKDNVIDASDTMISEDIVREEIPAGETRLLVNAVRLPDLPGVYKVLYQVNPEGALTELLMTNNISTAVDLTILPDYTATATVEGTYYLRGTAVPVTGKAIKSDGTPAAHAKVEVYVLVNGLRRTVSATTGADGRYTAQFVPLQNEAGHYGVGASYPGIGATTVQDQFDILGVRVNNGEVPQFKVIRNEPMKGTVPVQNLSNTALTNLSLQPVTLPNGATIRFDTVAVLDGNKTVNLGYTVSGTALSPGTNFQAASLNAAAKEGTIQPVNVWYYCQAPNAFLEASITDISVTTTATAGEKLVQFKLSNKGIGESGEVTLTLPQVSWLQTVTPAKLPSIAPGDTAVVVLKFLALPEVPFDFPAKGSIGIKSQNGNSFTLPFTFEKASQSTGTVKITVTNQFTYYSADAPKVKGARVVIKNLYSGQVYAEGVTDEKGVLTATGVPEGRHRVTVEKDQHLPYNGSLEVAPGRTQETTVFLNYQAITFNWSVEPTAVQDEYEITLETIFETNVPMPVVTIDMPKKMPQLSGSETYAFNVTMTNHGLITANDVKLGLPTDDPEYEFITNYLPANLLAQQSIQVPVIMRRRTTGSGGRVGMRVDEVSQFLGMEASQYSTAARMAGSGNCQGFTSVVYWYTCNTTTGLWQKGGALFSFSGRHCDPGPAPHYNGVPVDVGGVPTSDDGGYNDVPCATCGPGNGIQIPNPFPPAKEEKKSCKDCIDEIKGALGCAGPPSPKDAAECVGKNILKGAEWTDYIECIPVKLPPQLACLLALNKVMDKCSGIGSTGRMAGGSARVFGVSPLGAAFDRMALNLKTVERSMLLTQGWVNEYYGDMTNSDALSRLTAAIQSSVITLDSIRPGKQDSVLAMMAGYEIQPADIKAFFTRWNTSVYARRQGVLAPNSQYPNIINWTRAKSYADSIVLLHNAAVTQGFKSMDEMYFKEWGSLEEFIEREQAAVCASVTVQLSQRLAMTREAFEGTLEIFNGHPSEKMDSITVNIKITDSNGVPSNDLFQINTKSLSNLANITGTGAILSQQTGGVKFIFIPETGAAPTAPKVYNFSGSVTYWDPYVRGMVTMPLSAVPLTVNPSPSLQLHYFMQRNILGDDPLTGPIEPSEPAELGVMVENHGHGQAVNMTISSAQPKITDNEKGLAINFNLVGSNFQGQAKKLGVTDINFGTIPALQTRVGQWYFTSSLLGKFVGYSAQVVHSNSFGNPELSLVRGVKLHELTKSIKLYGSLDDGINDFLVNDIFDINDVPDQIYFSQGRRTAKVYEATTGSFDVPVAPPTFTNKVTVTPSQAGWNYIKLDDPGKRLYEIESVTRADGQEIPLDNAWLTYVTLPASQAPKYENKFHLVDTFSSAVPVTYTVVWKAKSTDIPKVDTITGAPKEVSATQVSKLKVVFNKAIDPATFTHEDLNLTFQGGANMMNHSVVITQEDSATFTVDLSSLTTGNGFYAFTVQAADVADVYGTKGETGKGVTWTQMLTVPVVQAFQGIPVPHVAQSYSTVDVLFNLPIDVTTVTAARFRILKGGVALPGVLSVDSVRTDHKLYYLSGLDKILTENGTYELEVDLPNIKTATGVAGIQKQSVLLTVDNVGPIVSLEKSGEGGLDALHIPFVDIRFNKDVAGFNTASLKLTRNGDVLPITFNMLSNTDLKTWKSGNFGMLTYPDGAYTFTIDMSTVKDAIGNFGSGTQTLSWTVDRASLITITNLGFTPDRGYNDKDAVTSGQNLSVTFNIDKDASRVTVYQYDLSGQTVLATADNVPAGAVSVPVSLLSAGNTGIRVMATGAIGGQGTAERAVFVDPVPLTGSWIEAQNQQLTRQVDTVSLSLSNRLLSSTGFKEALAFRYNGAPLSTASLSFKAVNDTVYQVSGIRGLGTAPGTYELSADLRQFSKYLSGKEGNSMAVLRWTVLSTNRAPVAEVAADTVATRTGTFVINGSRSYDPDADAITYRWIAPEGITLNDSTLAMPSFEVSGADNGKVYTFLLVVKDGSQFTTATVNVKVMLSPGTNLPVTWLYFRGQQKEKDALLTWATTSEEGAKEYVVERSLDGVNYSDIGTVAAKGLSRQSNNYSFVDKDAMTLSATALYYRLRQVDKNERYTYSTIVALPVKKDPATAVTVQVFPNPFMQNIVLQVTGTVAIAKNDEVALYTADGRIVYRRKLVIVGNGTVLLNDLPNLTQGLYLLKATINNNVYTLKLFRE